MASQMGHVEVVQALLGAKDIKVNLARKVRWPWWGHGGGVHGECVHAGQWRVVVGECAHASGVLVLRYYVMPPPICLLYV